MKNISLVTSDAIRKNQVNNSTSKNAFGFSKTKRFPSPNPEYLFRIFRCKVAFYSNDSQLSNRKASFGYGRKSDFTKTLTASPSVTTYTSKSVFEQNKGRGKSFGSARDRSPDTSYLIPQIHKNPGPGQVN